MKIAFFIIYFSVLTSLCVAQTETQEIAIIPEPVSIKVANGKFLLNENVRLILDKHAEVQKIGDYLKNRIATPTGFSLNTNTSSGAAIRLSINKKRNNTLGKEGYELSVTPKAVIISANEPAGLFYGVQTLLQLFPKEIAGNAVAKGVKWEIPIVEITDYPRFGWRGLMFDVSRHFFTKEEVKKFIDEMAVYKYNLLHLHLTDDEGWRIEIKSYPKLTEVGAWRVDKVGTFGIFTPPAADEPKNYGGYYTQDDIKEIVQYASDRYISILPEIDVPGHSLAAIASYPELSCTPGAEHYRVRSGEKIIDWKNHVALVDNTLCPANEHVYLFLDKVITELVQLFPFEYIHMGGDECFKNFWAESDAVNALMKREKLKDLKEVQSYFTKRVEKIVSSKGRKLIGWDEILEGGIAPSAAVMSWRGMKGGIEAAKMGHEVVMSPSTYVYLDYMQSDSIMEPPVYASLRLNKTYEFEPVPEGVNPKYIKGGQGNLWTEQVYNYRQVQYMIWPRALAVAESLWSPKEKKDWSVFFTKVEKHFDRFQEAEIKFAPSVYDPIFKSSLGEDQQLKIELETEVEGLDIYYSFDNSHPDHFYPKYTSALMPPKDATLLRVITYKGKTPVGRMNSMPIAVLKKRAIREKK